MENRGDFEEEKAASYFMEREIDKREERRKNENR